MLVVRRLLLCCVVAMSAVCRLSFVVCWLFVVCCVLCMVRRVSFVVC